jgi:hypothetical protein
MAMKRCLEDDEIERQLKCKICDMGLHSQVSEAIPHKGEIQLHDVEDEASIHIKKIKKICTLNFTIFKNKYLGLCMHFY